jgi:hypothetical protein
MLTQLAVFKFPIVKSTKTLYEFCNFDTIFNLNELVKS